MDLDFAETSLVLLRVIHDFPLAGLATLLVGFVLTVAMVQRVIFESPTKKQIALVCYSFGKLFGLVDCCLYDTAVRRKTDIVK